MSLHLADYEDTLDDLGGDAGDVLRATWQDAARVFSPRGLEAYLNGATGLKSLGRGTDLVVSFIESAPQVAREIGEQAVSDLLSTAIKMYSKTSASVLALLFSTAPTAAARLGELELFRGYLHLLDTLLAQAPRALRPMLERLDVLLTHLTLGGLRRWVTWGVSAHRTDLDGQARYFGLESPESLAVLQKEQRGVLFVDVQRRLNMYLRALWGRDFFLRPTSGDFETREGYQPYIEGYFIHLPDAFDDFAGSGETAVSGLEVYRAAAAHSAAHMVHSIPFPDADELTPLEKAMIGVVEDARVEALAVKAFPGVRQLWVSQLPADPALGDRAGPLMDRIARALIDEAYVDPHPLVAQARAGFGADAQFLSTPEGAHALGIALAARCVELGVAYHPHTDRLTSPYRDDNRHLWEPEDTAEQLLRSLGQQPQSRKYVSIMEMINAVDVETAGDDAQEVWVLATELYDDDGVSFNEREGKEPLASPVQYHEWDYQTQLERPAWSTVLEKRPKVGDPALIDAIAEKHKPVVARLRHLIESMQPQGVVRTRGREDGDEIDLNAAVRALTDLRMGLAPDPRIAIRIQRKIRDLSVLLLIDLSESTNDRVRDAETETTVLELAREATALLAGALAKIGDPFAIHGFDSNGRHAVQYYRFKDFDSDYDDKVRARLAGMTGQVSTRMGTAMRHAGALLKRQPSQKKLLLLLTDGEPADNDVRDPQYLRFDAKRAVEELSRAGIHSYCLTLDPYADQYVSRIFGARNYMVLDQVARLPEKLSMLYLGLTR